MIVKFYQTHDLNKWEENPKLRNSEQDYKESEMYVIFPGVKNNATKPYPFFITVYQASLMFLWAEIPNILVW